MNKLQQRHFSLGLLAEPDNTHVSVVMSVTSILAYSNQTTLTFGINKKHHRNVVVAFRHFPILSRNCSAQVGNYCVPVSPQSEKTGGAIDNRESDSCIMGSASVAASPQGKQPLFSFGVISDIQYADIPDGCSFNGVPRYYRHSLLVLQRAVQNWNNHRKLKFAINFGDIVDGYCPKDQSLNIVKKVVNEIEKFNGPVYHMIGNHCLYNLPRDKLLSLLNILTTDGRAYYDFSPTPEYRFVVLDGYDISAIGWPQDHPHTLEALKFLREKNPNMEKNSPAGLVGLERRFLMFNGAVGKEQMEWLDGVLQDATKLKQKVVVCCHLPLGPGATSQEAILWNYNEVLDVIHRYNCVKVCLAGHDHQGGHSIDAYGIHHRVFEAALECPPGTDAFGYIDVYDNRLSLVGSGRMQSTDMYFNP